jgi:predicted anti-sigma-YlaC factor YlaD
VDCATAREALSARLDGESSAEEDLRLEEHLRGCSACGAWSSSAADATRRLRLRPVQPIPDLADKVVGKMHEDDRRRDAWPPERWLLLVVGAVMLVFALPMLGPTGGDVHLLREAGVTDLALAVGVLFAAVQPWRAAGMLPVVLVLAAGLTVTSVADVVSGRVAPIEESVHTLAPTAALLLWRLRRRGPTWRMTPPGQRLHPVQDDRRSA